MDEDTAIRAWLSLIRTARKLPANKWELWSFMVGTGGALDERIRLGKAALAFFGRGWSFTPGGEEASDGRN